MSNVIKKVIKNGVEYDIYANGGAAGAGDVSGPASATNGHLAVFDGTTGKLIKDGGAVPTASSYDIKDLADSTGLRTTWNNKQNALSTQTAYTTKGTATKVPTITTNTLGQVTGITETNINFPVTSVNGQYGDVVVAGKEYNAGEGIEIGNDYSAMQGPAPDGFHVPLNTEWQAVYDVWKALGGGRFDGTNFGIALKLPFTGSRSSSSAGVSGQGSIGLYWSSSRNDTSSAYYLYFYSSNLRPQNSSNRANGLSVRCFKNSPVIPTSSWTKLYGTSIEAGGIFWSSTDGLISLSSNGSTWITIADKNLGATNVWNSGDTLSEANCGKYYQRGNNYGFPRTGSVTTSSTQVNAGTYGPGNYYSSSTFITISSSPYRWDSTDNGNLWGGVTGVVSNAITNTGVLSVNGQTGDVTVDSGITKIFTLSSTSDLTTAQAAYDWWVNGGVPVITINGYMYFCKGVLNNVFRFFAARGYGASSNDAWSDVDTVELNISSSSVTSITLITNRINIRTSAPTSGNNSTITLVI